MGFDAHREAHKEEDEAFPSSARPTRILLVCKLQKLEHRVQNFWRVLELVQEKASSRCRRRQTFRGNRAWRPSQRLLIRQPPQPQVALRLSEHKASTFL